MKWRKCGLIYGPDGSLPWAKHSALQPTPILIDENIIRLYVGFRDQNGVGRVGYVDVDAANPKNVLTVSTQPCLDIGQPGAFDDNGVVPSAVVKKDNKFYLYYAGYNLQHHVRFLVLAGLAMSENDGKTFTKVSQVPIFERTDDELLFRVPHTVMFDQNKWKIWYGGGSHFLNVDGKTLPVYDIRYVESADGINIPKCGQVVIPNQGDEHRVARPYVIKHDHIYKMFNCVGTISKGYKLGYAESQDGVSWIRKDNELRLNLSEEGWDSEMMGYPSIIISKYGTYLFYNGNNYGYEGFGYAVLEQW